MTLARRLAHTMFPIILILALAGVSFAQNNFQRPAHVLLPEEPLRFGPVDDDLRGLAREFRPRRRFESSGREQISQFDPSPPFTEKDFLDSKSLSKISLTKAQKTGSESFLITPALKQTLLMIAVQHGFRMMQEKTRNELGGPFFADWARSVKSLRGWNDMDSAFTNYVAHPLQGATTGRIYVTNSRTADSVEFGASKQYWKSRMEAMAWSAFWSTQFELGPISEASIGNVGMTRKYGKSTMGWVDLVMTPTAGTAILIGEDAIEKYVLKRMLRDSGGRVTTRIKIWRSLLTPIMSVTNMLGGKPPWSRRSNFMAAAPLNDSDDSSTSIRNSSSQQQ